MDSEEESDDDSEYSEASEDTDSEGICSPANTSYYSILFSKSILTQWFFSICFSRGRIGQFRGVRQGLVGSGARSGRRGQGKGRRSLPRRLQFQQEEEDQSQTIYTPVEGQVSIQNRFNILTRIFTYSGRIYL